MEKKFEWDDNKSRANYVKHGIEFKHATALWLDLNAAKLKLQHESEERYIRIGKLNNKIWTAVFCHRNNKIRLISVRRARAKERQYYDKKDFDTRI